jgi:hypothetical protein
MSIIMLIQNYRISIAQLNPFCERKQNILLHSIIFLPSSGMEFLHMKGHSKEVACTSNIMKIVSAHLLVTRLSTDTLRKMYSFIALIAHPVNRVLATFCLCVLVVYPLHVSRTVWSFTTSTAHSTSRAFSTARACLLVIPRPLSARWSDSVLKSRVAVRLYPLLSISSNAG